MGNYDSSAHWERRSAPSSGEIETLARVCFSAMPAPFHQRAGHVTITVKDYPSQTVSDHLALETPFDLLGIFEGDGSAHYWTPSHSSGTATSAKNQLTLFRRAILDYWCENNEPLDEIVAHVIITELGHHFGMSDEEMRNLETTL